MESIETQIELHPTIIIRTPVFSLQTSLVDKAEELRKYILDASPELYQHINHSTIECLLNLNNKTSLSFYKYFNRAKFRPIPFGLFAAVSIVEGNELSTNLTIGKKFNPKRLPDWDYKDSFGNLDAKIQNANFFRTNSTVYSNGNLYRYITLNNGIFQIVEILAFPELSFILELCKEKIKKEELLDKIELNFHLNRQSIANLLKDLTAGQLLFSDLSPNIVGEDFFSRCNFYPSSEHSKSYIISERDDISGSYQDTSLPMMSELINHLNSTLPYLELSYLDKFKRHFLGKFDRQLIPLSIAMDPELGVGYADLESTILNSGNQLEKIFAQNKLGSNLKIQNNPYLLYALSRSSNKVVRMEEFGGISENKLPNLPNSFSVLYHNYGANPVIASIGGTSANNLIGRFTICNKKMHQLTLEIAEIEQRANPFVSFFDVAYQGEKHVDNINRRQKIYEYELPLLTWSENSNVLNVEDIEIAVIDDEIVLFSKKMKRRILPKIPTAYNYHRSDLGIYRFLSDLQHQGIRSDLNLRLMDFFPNLDHYPRICYKQFILSAECWRLPDELISSMRVSFKSYEIKITQWLKSLSLDGYFKTGHGDKTLTFDPNSDDDMKAFSLYCFHSTESQLYIYEALIDKNSALQTDDGETFSGQILLNMYHKRENHKLKEYPETAVHGTQRRLLPGSEWLYVEIYCHPIRTNEILTSGISTFIKRNGTNFKKWFFLRYSKNGNHIRIRFHLKDPQKTAFILNDLNKCINDFWQKGYISDLQVKTYQREMERYGFAYEDIETFFYYDSKSSLNFLRRKNSANFLYQFALSSMKMVLNEAFTDFDRQLEFVSLLSNSFANEFSFDKSSYKLVNKEYEKSKLAWKMKISFQKNSKRQLKVLNQILSKCRNADQKYVILADLIHLHINRIFSDNARGQEAILYQYLLKDLKRSMHLSTHKQVLKSVR